MMLVMVGYTFTGLYLLFGGDRSIIRQVTCRAVFYIDVVPGDDTPRLVGWFRYYFADERWEWSEQVQRLHSPARPPPQR